MAGISVEPGDDRIPLQARSGSEEDHQATSQDFSFASDDVQDEKEGLLGSWNDDDVLGEEEGISQPRRTPAYVLPLVLLGSAILLGIGLVSILRATLGLGTVVLEPTVRSNDYILDPNWDFNSSPQRREYHWEIRDHQYAPDGILRPMILVNNEFPGPLIEVNEGDTIVVHVDNQAANATSIHWHGIYQRGSPWMDGTVGVTQCPIAPGTQFTYEFTVSGQSGTYWWHAHYGVQSSDGLHGPLIVHGRKERELQQLDYASDRVILISDHYHDLSSALLWQYLKPDMENAEPVPNGALINGKAEKACARFPDRPCDNSSDHKHASIALQAGQSHRLRLINVGAFAEFQVQIDEHEIAVTEVDGTDIVPTSYHRLHIAPAQRYSILVTADKSQSRAYWLRARMQTKCFTDAPPGLHSEVRAIVQYSHNGVVPIRTPTSQDWDEVLDLQCRDMNVTELAPVEKLAAPSKADGFFYLRANFEIGAYRLSRGFFNTTSWRPDISSPSLLRAMEGLAEGNTSFTATEMNEQAAFVNDMAFDISKELVVQTTGPQTIDLLISNFDDGNHPLHLHGYKYFVLAQGHGYPPLTEAGADIMPENLTPLYDSLDLSNPLRRDTASVEGFGWILLRIVADNPGAWAFHCHVSWHSEAGLMMQLITGTEELADTRMPEAMRGLCGREGIERGMGPRDEDYEALAR